MHIDLIMLPWLKDDIFGTFSLFCRVVRSIFRVVRSMICQCVVLHCGNLFWRLAAQSGRANTFDSFIFQQIYCSHNPGKYCSHNPGKYFTQSWEIFHTILANIYKSDESIFLGNRCRKKTRTQFSCITFPWRTFELRIKILQCMWYFLSFNQTSKILSQELNIFNIGSLTWNVPSLKWYILTFIKF